MDKFNVKKWLKEGYLRESLDTYEDVTVNSPYDWDFEIDGDEYKVTLTPPQFIPFDHTPNMKKGFTYLATKYDIDPSTLMSGMSGECFYLGFGAKVNGQWTSDLTGKGDALKVIGTVMNSTLELLPKHHPDCKYIIFHTTENKRKRAYNVLLQKAATKAGWDADSEFECFIAIKK